MVVRGVYHPPHVPVTDDTDLLHLVIEAKTQESLDKAVEEIETIMKEQKVGIVLCIVLYILRKCTD